MGENLSNYKDPNNDVKNSATDEQEHRSRSRSKKESRKEKFNQKLNFAKKNKDDNTTAETGEAGETKAFDLSKINKKKVLIIALCGFLALCLAGIVYVGVIIYTAPAIETDNIYSLLSQSTILYDDEGEIIDTAYGDQNRTIVEISQIPEHVQYAFIALEDKTFEKHNGFNVIRIFGALKDAVFNGGRISGTSTITQQLSRNLYLQDEMYDRNLARKIREAYYAIQLEKELSKDEILEAYLNTIYFGNGYGVQAAAQAYFSKDISEVTVAEAAALAAMPQAPTDYALVYAVDVNEVTDKTPNLILKTIDTAYLWNDAAKDRIQTCLYLMHEQGYITDEQYEEAKKVEIKDMVNPNLDALNSFSNYFADYTLETVLNDLQEDAGYSYEEAYELVYNGGLKIYTTMDSQAQSVVETEFANEDNFPTAIGYSTDTNGNILDQYGDVLLYSYSNYINAEGEFTLTPDDYKKNEDGSLTIYYGKRLNIYTTTVAGETDYSVEFKNMYVEDEEGHLYSIQGGYINIPQQFKSRDKDDNLVISAEFFEEYPTFFVEKDGNLATTEYTLNPRTIQPQAAMTIVDNYTGQIKAMIGGRNISGRMLYNRAVAPQQPGSSIKPLAVYASALQRSYELSQAGETFPFTNNGFDKQAEKGWGTYLTTASIVDDEPTTINGRIWPANSYSGYEGLYTFRTALQQSVNVCAVKILSQVGVDYAGSIVEKFGISTLSTDDLNLAALGLGGMVEGVSTLEMASAYTTFINGGVHKDYSVYTKVTTRNGDLLLEPKVSETEVLDAGVAWIMSDVLRTVVSEGIGSPAAISGISVGGKTGTTDDQFDIWFCGFTPSYSAALWIGNDVNIALSSYSNSAAYLWGKIMGQIEANYGGSYPSAPGNVVSASIDTKSGLLATEASGSDVRTEYFTAGTQPTASDNVHRSVDICTESGYISTPSCTKLNTKTGIMRPYVPNEKVKDIGNELPHYYCNLHNPDPNLYPTEPGKPVTIVQPKPSKEESEKEDNKDKNDKTDKTDKNDKVDKNDKEEADKPSSESTKPNSDTSKEEDKTSTEESSKPAAQSDKESKDEPATASLTPKATAKDVKQKASEAASEIKEKMEAAKQSGKETTAESEQKTTEDDKSEQ